MLRTVAAGMGKGVRYRAGSVRGNATAFRRSAPATLGGGGQGPQEQGAGGSGCGGEVRLSGLEARRRAWHGREPVALSRRALRAVVVRGLQ